MSFLMYARPVPRQKLKVLQFNQLKYVVAKSWFGHDGSLRSEYKVLGEESIKFLKGVVAARQEGDEVHKEALELIDLIERNPQGVKLWIGDEDDDDRV